MLSKKILTVSISVLLCCGYSQVAQACEDKFTSAAFGSLEKSDLDRLKEKFLSVQRSLKFAVPVYLYDVQGILGFSGEQTKTASNGRIEDRIWIDRENCQRQVKASFRDRELVKIKIYGF
ncbi:MAG TPA: hypothetical protein V6C71_12375 [Coleofasciculaceae cyanobacterium]|jgi:hypothetical protein